MNSGTLYGIGVGPGDPELLTLRAVRLIESCPVLAYPANPTGQSQARAIAARWLGRQREIAIRMPFQRDRGPANAAYDRAAAEIAECLAAGLDVAVLCEGDPLLFGSFGYLLERLHGRFPCQVVPGVSSVLAAAAASLTPLALLEQSLCILPASAGEEALRRALAEHDSVAILKPGRAREQVLRLLRESGRLGDAVYLESVSRDGQRIVHDLATLQGPGPYFALILVTRR
ncbi:MAG TPA: precorrin-2 C(20)-methyltransferase [Candidatus Competibacteraceae bacterium]|nr:precorrin-2 C(20)-methyltransferase [Candidatus Competibacteraceae bacterium]